MRTAHSFNQDAFGYPHAYPTEGEVRKAYSRLLRGQRMSRDEIADMPGEPKSDSDSVSRMIVMQRMWRVTWLRSTALISVGWARMGQ